MQASDLETPKKTHQSDLKAKVGEKRSLKVHSAPSVKRIKMKDLESVIRSEGISSHHLQSLNTKLKSPAEAAATNNNSHSRRVRINLNSSEVIDERVVKEPYAHQLEPGLDSLDLNNEASIDENSACDENATGGTMDASKQSSSVIKGNNNMMGQGVGGMGLDLNMEDVASSAANLSNLLSFKVLDNAKSRDSWECGSTTGPLNNSASLRKWAEMKQHGFVSPNFSSNSSHPPAPNKRGRKSKSEILRRKMEQAKQEQVDRFAKMAAPSGLLNGLNPGIINHVRNSKQVHSIIQAMVGYEKGQKHFKTGGVSKEQEVMNSLKTSHSNVFHGSALPGFMTSYKHQPYTNQEKTGRDRSVYMDFSDPRCRIYQSAASLVSMPASKGDDPLALKLSSSATMVSKYATSTLTNEESVNADSVDSLSVKAASVASQWLQLMQQDIRGRLTALRRSKKKVHEAICTELPFLFTKEFSNKQDITLHNASGSVIHSEDRQNNGKLHHTHWTKLFVQMEQNLIEEEKHLESWLHQVDQLQSLCQKGLQAAQLNERLGLPLLGSKSEGELVKAAAASLYSMCTFAASMINVKCC